ncbi:MAG: hypothetical protein FXV80_05925, partial [Candidatus Thioglobus sp.]
MKRIVIGGFKLAKFSVWIGAVLTLIIALFLSLAMAFPLLVKAPIESQLSNFSNFDIGYSKLNLGFNNGSFVVQMEGLEVASSGQKALIAKVDNLQWDINLSTLLKPNKIAINTLTLYPEALSKQQIQEFLHTRNVDFIKLLGIDKTIVKGAKEFEIAPILLTQNSLKISGQELNFTQQNANLAKVDIEIILPKQTAENQSFIVPILISNDELSMDSEVKFFNKDGDDWLEFEGNLPSLKIAKIIKYLPPQLLSEEGYAWIKDGFIDGDFVDVKLQIKKNISTQSAIDVHLDAELKNMQLLFNPKWNTLKNMDASLTLDGAKISAIVHSAELNNMTLKNVKAQIADLSKDDLDVEVWGEISSQSELMLEFLKDTPLDAKTKAILHKIKLSGAAKGAISVVVPLDERAVKMDADLQLTDNRLGLFNEVVVVDDYNTNLAFHNNKISTIGAGNFRGSKFDININPEHKNDEQQGLFAVQIIGENDLIANINRQFDQSWRGAIKSKFLRANVAIFLDEKQPANVHLSDVYIHNLDAIKGDWNIKPQDFPSMYLRTKNVNIDEDELPDFKVDLVANSDFIAIKKLQFEGVEVGYKKLSFDGFWRAGEVNLNVGASGNNLTEFLQKLKIKEKVRGGAFDFKLNIACKCAPWNMNYQNITGDFDM